MTEEHNKGLALRKKILQWCPESLLDEYEDAIRESEAESLRERDPATQGALWGTGWIYGNNLKRRAKIADSKGEPDGEPWYVTEDGTSWSALDVTYRPDPAASPDEQKGLKGPCPLCGRTDNHTHTSSPFGLT